MKNLEWTHGSPKAKQKETFCLKKASETKKPKGKHKTTPWNYAWPFQTKTICCRKNNHTKISKKRLSPVFRRKTKTTRWCNFPRSFFRAALAFFSQQGNCLAKPGGIMKSHSDGRGTALNKSATHWSHLLSLFPDAPRCKATAALKLEPVGESMPWTPWAKKPKT